MDPSPPRGSPSRPLPSNHDSNTNDQNQHHRVRFAEGEPQASYKIYQPTPKRQRPPAAASAAAGPAVYWDNKGGGKEADRESDANRAGYTFYREGTPTPPDYEAPEKGRGGRGLAAPVTEGSTAGGGTINSDRDLLPAPLDRSEIGNWSLADSNDMSPRTKKRVLWTIIAVGVFILIGIAVGVGVGLGVGLQKGEGPMAEPAGEPSRSVVHAGNFRR